MPNLTITDINDPRAYIPRFLESWIREAHERQVKYLIVVCDTFDDDAILAAPGGPPGCDYPVFARDDEEMNAAVLEFHHKNMQEVQGIYQVRNDLGGMRVPLDPHDLPIVCLICNKEGKIEEHVHPIPPEEER